MTKGKHLRFVGTRPVIRTCNSVVRGSGHWGGKSNVGKEKGKEGYGISRQIGGERKRFEQED